ncbi:MAG: hypothetical protein JHC92_08545 [Sphingomonadaceae bacterium]|jgi:hypothetical protein|nr:hypothetical protein [Sphingomonadaceae bacterium]
MMMNMQNRVDPDPKPYSPPNEVPGTTPDEVHPDDLGDTDYPGSIPNETPVESPPSESSLLN